MKFSKLEFEIIDLGPGKDMGVKVTLDGKSVVMETFGRESAMCPGLKDLPDMTVGGLLLEEVWGIGHSLLKCSEVAEGQMWRVVEDWTMEEAYNACN